MSDMTTGELRGFIDTMRGGDSPRECVVTGTVVRVDPDGTAWVQIGSNAEPTPCARDMACHAGDEVTVRIADHRATVTGNASAPATDDHAANVAHGVASAAQHTADTAQATAQEADGRAQAAQRTSLTALREAEGASTAAGEAKALAELTDQHFWNDTRGAHVTEVKQDVYAEQPSGFARLLTSAGDLLTRAVGGVERLLRSDTASGTVFYDGECAPDAQDLEDHVVAAFTASGAQIGAKDSAHVEMDFNTFRLTDKDNVDFFVADDLRGSDGLATVTETFMGNGTTREFEVTYTPDSFVSVTDSSHEGAAYTTSGNLVRFSVAPSDGATVTVTYKTASTSAKVYTLGTRASGSVEGPMSVAEGRDVTASGFHSHAEGDGTIASGVDSHAEGVGGERGAASGFASHAEGAATLASGDTSHAEGNATTASGVDSHAEGVGTTASGSRSHAEGSATTASGFSAHAEGQSTLASGYAAHTEGLGTTATSDYQHVQGKYNVADANDTYAHIVGNGTSDSNRSNAHTVDWSGNGWYAGEVKGSDCKSANYSLEDVGDSISQCLKVINCISPSHTVGANGFQTYSYTPTAVAGYTAIGVVGSQNTGERNACIVGALVDTGANKIYTMTKNFTSSAQTVQDHIRVLYVRSDLL